MIERVHIIEDFQTMGHRVIIAGRQYPGATPSYLTADGEWEPITEISTSIDPGDIGFRFPEGALDALVSAARNVTPTVPAIEQHLADAIAVRDRLLTIVERA